MDKGPARQKDLLGAVGSGTQLLGDWASLSLSLSFSFLNRANNTRLTGLLRGIYYRKF